MPFDLAATSWLDTLADQGWVVMDDFLSVDEALALQHYAAAREAAGDFHRAGVGRGAGLAVREDVRGDTVRWLDESSLAPPETVYWSRIEAVRAALNRQLYLGLRRGEYHYAHYPVGTGYQRHLDRFRDHDARTVSAVCYLNADWQQAEGGALRLWLDADPNGPFEDISPCAGRLVLFLSDRFWHAVLPATRPRWSLTGWMRRDDGLLG
jgi:SM-20-related protein